MVPKADAMMTFQIVDCETTVECCDGMGVFDIVLLLHCNNKFNPNCVCPRQRTFDGEINGDILPSENPYTSSINGSQMGMFGITAWFLNALRGAIQQGWASGMECEGWVVDAEVKFHLKPLCRRYNSTRVSICQVTSAAGGQP